MPAGLSGEGAWPPGAGSRMQMKEPGLCGARGAMGDGVLGPAVCPGVPLPCGRSQPRCGDGCTAPGGPIPPATAAAAGIRSSRSRESHPAAPRALRGADPTSRLELPRGASVPAGQERWEKRRRWARGSLL